MVSTQIPETAPWKLLNHKYHDQQLPHLFCHWVHRYCNWDFALWIGQPFSFENELSRNMNPIIGGVLMVVALVQIIKI